MLGDTTGLATEYRGYDAYGKPRNSDWSDKSPATINSSVTDRGFTDHEHLDDWQLIHMNGRGYDYNLGRFLSIDPIIGDPGNSQSINAYAYIMNNPLSGTDPTGYCGTASRIDGGGGASNCAVIMMAGPEDTAGQSITKKLAGGTTVTTTVTPTDNGAEITIQGTGPDGKQIVNQTTTLSPDEIGAFQNSGVPTVDPTLLRPIMAASTDQVIDADEIIRSAYENAGVLHKDDSEVSACFTVSCVATRSIGSFGEAGNEAKLCEITCTFTPVEGKLDFLRKGSFTRSFTTDARNADGRAILEEGAPIESLGGLTPAIADTSEKADNGHGGVSCQKEESTRRSSNVKRLPCRIS